MLWLVCLAYLRKWYVIFFFLFRYVRCKGNWLVVLKHPGFQSQKYGMPDHTDLHLSIKQRNKKCKPPLIVSRMKWWKNFIKSGTQLHIQLAVRREFMYKHYSVFLLRKKYFHRLENDLTRNIIHPNNKRKPKIANKNAGKVTCQYGQPVWVWNVVRNLCHDFHLHFQVLWLTPLF